MNLSSARATAVSNVRLLIVCIKLAIEKNGKVELFPLVLSEICSICFAGSLKLKLAKSYHFSVGFS